MASKLTLRMLSSALLLGLVCFAASSLARHGEGNILTNRIPEPAPYVVEETTANTALGGPAGQCAPPPFENLWTSIDDVNGCDGCHTGLYNQWNGSMMANAWRDPGLRGAFLLVARLTSTDGCSDITPVLTVAWRVITPWATIAAPQRANSIRLQVHPPRPHLTWCQEPPHLFRV